LNPVPRWSNYVLASGADLRRLLADHCATANRDVCVILGEGFDPRMNTGLRAVLQAGGLGRRHVIRLKFDEGYSSPSRSYEALGNQNLVEFQDLTKDRCTIDLKNVKMWAADGRRISSRSAASLFSSPKDFADFSDLFLDISALPRSIFYPLLAKLLYLQEKDSRKGKPLNLFVLVAENAELDGRIIEEGVDESADYVHLFRSSTDRIASVDEPKIWIPILGESQRIQLERLYELVMPQEMCPVLPSPAHYPRRGDNMIIEYRELLFDRLRVEPRNIIFAAERNPFEVYRQVRKTVLHYQKALAPLGGCHPIVSSVSTKLLSTGALLAAYELKQFKLPVGIAHIETHGYRIEHEQDLAEISSRSSLFGLWLSGECYV
jgi:hypothetical protein